MTAKKKQLLIESCEFVSKVRIPKELKESLELSKGKSGTLIVRNIPCTICNRRNLNGRIYSTQIIQAAIDEAKPLIESKQLLSQACEHPEGSFVSPTTASHVIIGAYVKPNVELMVDGKKERQDVLFMDWEVLNTQEGQNLRALLEAECSVGVSIRGVGDLDGDKVIEYSIYGCDAVGQPSSGTYTRMPVSESVQVELVDREPMSEGFVVTTSSTNVVGDLEKAAVIQANLDNATYGTVVKTHTTLDSEVDPKTGATTEITTLEAETEDEVGTLDQALQMAKNAILNPTVNVDSVTIENVKDEDEVKAGGKKEAAPEYVPEEGIEMNEEEADYPKYQEVHAARPGFYPFSKYFDAAIAKFGDAAWDMTCNFLDTDMNIIYTGKIKSVLGEEQTYQWLADNDNAYYGIDFLEMPLEQWLETEYKEPAQESIKEAKEKDPKEGKQFVLKAPNGYVSMEGNALTFREDPKKALHFIVGKENTGLVHLSEVEKILDTMGVYDIQKYYKRDLGDISATAEEQNAPVEEKTVNNVQPVAVNNVQNAMLTEDNPSNTRYVATVASEGQGNTSDTETVPVSATEPGAILSEVGNLWKQKSKDGSQNLMVMVKDTTNGAEYAYNPANNTLEPTNGGAPIAIEQPQAQNVDQSLTVEDPAVMESEDEAGIEQDDNKLTMTVNPDDEDPVEIEKEFDSKAQATVAKAGLEKGDIDGSVMLNEEDITYDDVPAGWYAGVTGIGVIGPFATEEEARAGLEEYGDKVDIEYIGPTQENSELEEAGAGAAVGAGLGSLFGPVGTVAGGALGSMAQDYLNRKDPGKKTQGWKSGALLGGMVGGVPGALIGGGLQHIMTGNNGAADAIKSGAKAVGNKLKSGAAAFKRGFNAAMNKDSKTANTQQAASTNNDTAQVQNTQAQPAQPAQSAQQQAAVQAQNANASTQVLQQVQSTQAQIQQALTQLQQLQQSLQNTQLNANTPIWQGKITRGKDGKFRSLRAEGVDEAAEMDEVLFTGEPEASDPVIEQPLKDAENRVTVVLKDIDWDVDSVVANSSNSDNVNSNDMYDTVNGLPNELTISLNSEELGDEPAEAKQAILNAANNQSQYKINDATIASIQ